ncbi:hypothetical protein [Protofrankia symbiont of Coriaria ruscifolia]|uniref:hypothetical protein n=1 Tax=Protofrankia symbiont of Coriaria ruscifolia TaxID=1306542 RepID=UPI001A947386|nr:hypothetical protein [Protofrankia symbiont of Coriaria ruscifolia]
MCRSLISAYLALAASVGLAVAAPAAARRLPPRRAATLLVAAAVIAGCGWTWDLALLAWTLIGQFPPVRRLGRWSSPVLATNDPVSPITAIIAAGTSALPVLRCGRDVSWLLRTARHAHAAADGGLVVLDDPAPRALAVPGLPGRVMVTSSCCAPCPRRNGGFCSLTNRPTSATATSATGLPSASPPA